MTFTVVMCNRYDGLCLFRKENSTFTLSPIERVLIIIESRIILCRKLGRNLRFHSLGLRNEIAIENFHNLLNSKMMANFIKKGVKHSSSRRWTKGNYALCSLARITFDYIANRDKMLSNICYADNGYAEVKSHHKLKTISYLSVVTQMVKLA